MMSPYLHYLLVLSFVGPEPGSLLNKMGILEKIEDIESESQLRDCTSVT